MCDNQLNGYLQQLMDEVLSKNYIPTAPYRILLSRDSESNAYNTGDGTIVIDFGLFRTVENEDELVYVISHEIGHQFLNHLKTDIEDFAKLSTSPEIINRTEEIRKQKYGKAALAVDLLKKISYKNYSHRRRHEIEADSIGLHFYNKTLRNPNAPLTILQKFDDADVERDSLTIADYKTVFNGKFFNAKDHHFAEEESLFKNQFNVNRFDVDSLKSHPACGERIIRISNKLGMHSSKQGRDPGIFSEIKKISYYQNVLNLYVTGKYGLSLYESAKLYKAMPTVEIRQCIYNNLVKMKAARMAYTINRHMPGIDQNIHTESLNRFIRFINNLRLADFDGLINQFKL